MSMTLNKKSNYCTDRRHVVHPGTGEALHDVLWKKNNNGCYVYGVN